MYADFESILKGIHSNDSSNNAFYTKKYNAHVSYSFPYKVVCIDDRVSQLFFREEKNAVNKFIEEILKENKYCKKMMKKHLNKNLVMSVEDQRYFKSSNKCNELFAADDSKITNRHHVTIKYIEVLLLKILRSILN